jgi:predicted nucleic acid-binding protein
VLLDHDLILGHNVLRELEKALRDKVKLPAVRSSEIVGYLASEADQVVDKAEPASVNVDAADALVLGEALASHADLFVTGDAALLRLAAVGALKIVSPRQFWEILRAGNV